MKKIGLVVAMPEETEHILDKLGDVIKEHQEIGFNIIEYCINDKNIYLINSGIGEINSAAATTILLSKFKVECIINFGIAGALKDNLRVGDLLVAKDIVHYDFDVSAFLNVPRGRYLDSDTTEIACDENLIQLSDEANGSSLMRIRIASADKFVATTKVKQELIDTFDADICEMESAGIIRVCKRAKIPALFIKTISDNADEKAEETMDKTLSNGIHAYSKLIQKLIEIL